MVATDQAPSLQLGCPEFEGVDAVADLATSHVVILGEAMHGTAESPWALFALACQIASQGERIRIGLEATYTETGVLDAFLSDPKDMSALRTGDDDMWSVYDGRSSLAIVRLLRRLSELRANGADVTVFAFDADGSEWVGADNQEIARDAAMARHVDDAVDGFDGAVLLLTGSFHARKSAFSYDVYNFVPMATRIASRDVLSLEMRHAGGAAWMNGEVDGEAFEGVITLDNLLPADAPLEGFVLTPSPPDYDGAYYTGPITASRPAFPEASAP